MTFVSAGYVILTPTQPVGSWPLELGSNPHSRDQKSHTALTELAPIYHLDIIRPLNPGGSNTRNWTGVSLLYRSVNEF